MRGNPGAMTPYRDKAQPIEAPRPRQILPHHRPLSPAEGAVAMTVTGVPVVLIGGAVVAFLVLEDPRVLAVVAALVLGAIVMLLRHRFLVSTWSGGIARANALLAEREPERAALLLDRLARQSRASPSFHACTLVLLALAWMRLGDVALALDLLRLVDASGRMESPRVRAWQLLLLSGLTTACALSGELELAERHRERARTLGAEGVRAVFLVPSAIVELMRGRNERALADLEPAAEDKLSPSQDNLVKLLRAFALDRLGRKDDAKAALAGAWAPLSSETRLVDLWPDLGDFAAKHGMLSPE